eukprot:CAMPEP_0197657442 /NCGR_PEP_ID=MMETSP1338-20131121/44629_1 /TAXON_ID=43686 ORGANISM="Pelagodinium beii, Strain RCC1491" /NCGR_SAMPLE_ID=MMETSP1338 /ASSEMBLY_ACC=CAM_ASM_000754 /LENGTH=364 /DNA_ID=CAMNT_0043233809 /DNA_START=160 /DNA_END=1254 /DNA_ORIENTATION=+
MDTLACQKNSQKGSLVGLLDNELLATVPSDKPLAPLQPQEPVAPVQPQEPVATVQSRDFTPALRGAKIPSGITGPTNGASDLLTITQRQTETCGFEKDCPRRYTAEQIVQSAEAYDLSNEHFNATLYAKHVESLNYCMQTLIQQRSGPSKGPPPTTKSGGWCLAGGEQKTVSMQSGGSYTIPKFYAGVDDAVLATLMAVVDEGPHISINDFGAGAGQYGYELLAARPHVRYSGYDGAGDVEAFTNGFVKFFDMTIPLALPKTDWVFSVEVGEHVPNSLEPMMMRNLHVHNCKGIIMSWAALNQGGHAHVNCHSRHYVQAALESLGYYLDEGLTSKVLKCGPPLRRCHGWFRGTAFVFRRREPVC